MVPRRGRFIDQPVDFHLPERLQRPRKGRHPDCDQDIGRDCLFGAAVAVAAPELYLSGEQRLQLSEIGGEAGGTAHGFRLLGDTDALAPSAPFPVSFRCSVGQLAQKGGFCGRRLSQ